MDDDRRPVRRPRRLVGKPELVRAVIGAMSGAIGGLGAGVVLVQGGHVGVSWPGTIAWGSVVLGAAIGFIGPEPWVMRAVLVLLTIGAAFVFVRGTAAPATAAAPAPACTANAIVDGTTVDLTSTSRSAPLSIDVDEDQIVAFRVEAPGVEHGVVDITVASISPLSSFVDVGDSVVYFDDVDDGVATGDVEIVSASDGRFHIVGERWSTSALAFGLMQLDVRVSSVTGTGTVDACRITAWVRAVASPMGNTLGRVGLGMTALGAIGLLLVGPLRGALPHAARPTADSRSRRSPQVAPGRPVLDEAHLVDDEGLRVGPTDPLVVGREYRLVVSVAPGVEQVDDDRPPAEPAGRIAIRAPGAVVGPTLSLSLFGAPLGFGIRPIRHGRLDLDVEHVADDGTIVLGRLGRTACVPADAWPPPSGDRAPARYVWPAPVARHLTTGGRR